MKIFKFISTSKPYLYGWDFFIESFGLYKYLDGEIVQLHAARKDFFHHSWNEFDRGTVCYSKDGRAFLDGYAVSIGTGSIVDERTFSDVNLDRILAIKQESEDFPGSLDGYKFLCNDSEYIAESFLTIRDGLIIVESKDDDNSIVRRINFTGQEVWKACFKDVEWLEFPDEAQALISEYSDFICVFSGFDRQRLYVINREDGKTKWSFKPEGWSNRHHFISDDLIIYAATDALYLLEPETGALINTIELPEEQFRTSAVFDGEHIYVFISRECSIRIYDKTAHQLIKTVDLPEPYFWLPTVMPYFDEQNLYVPLNSNEEVHGAVAVIPKAELLNRDSLEVEFEAVPEHNIECIKNEDDSDHYELTIWGGDIDWVLRYAGVLAVDIVARYAHAPEHPETLNEDFNGLIKIYIKDVDNNARDNERLNQLKYYVEKSCEDSYRNAGIHSINIEAEWV